MSKGLPLRVGCGFYSDDLARQARENQEFRKVLVTTPQQQVTLMYLKPGQSIGLERHPRMTQFVYIVKGTGYASASRGLYQLHKNSMVVIWPGDEHDVWADSDGKGLWLFSVYSYAEDHGAPHARDGDEKVSSPLTPGESMIGYVSMGYMQKATTHRVVLFESGRYRFFHAGAEADGEREVDSALVDQVFDLARMLRWRSGLPPADPGVDRGVAYFTWGTRHWMRARDAPQLGDMFLKIDAALAAGPGGIPHHSGFGGGGGDGSERQGIFVPTPQGLLPLMCEYTGCASPDLSDETRDVYMCPSAHCDALYCSEECYFRANAVPREKHECGMPHRDVEYVGRSVIPGRRHHGRKYGLRNAAKRRELALRRWEMRKAANLALPMDRFHMERASGNWRPSPMPAHFRFPIGCRHRRRGDDGGEEPDRAYRAYRVTHSVVQFQLESSVDEDPVREWLRDEGDFKISGDIATRWTKSAPLKYTFEVPTEDADQAARVLEDHGYIDK